MQTKQDVYTNYDEARREILDSWDEMSVVQRSFVAQRLLEADVAMLVYDERTMYPVFSVDTMRIARKTWDGDVYFLEVTDSITDTPLACFSVSADTGRWEIINKERDVARVIIAAYRLLSDYRYITRED